MLCPHCHALDILHRRPVTPSCLREPDAGPQQDCERQHHLHQCILAAYAAPGTCREGQEGLCRLAAAACAACGAYVDAQC